MAIERKWAEVAPQSITSISGQKGELNVPLACLFKVGQTVILKGNSLPPLQLKIKRIPNLTSMLVGDPGQNIEHRVDVSAYTPAVNATIFANEQNRPNIAPDDIIRFTYEEEPAMAVRSMLVDKCGEDIGQDPTKPFHVRLGDGSVNIGSVNAELEVQLSHRDNFPDAGDVADSVQIGDGEDILRINPDGSISTADSGLDRRFDIENNIVYEAFAEPGAGDGDPLWRISRTVKTPSGDFVTNLAGTGKFDQIWNNRASLFPAVTEENFFDRRFERLLPLLSNANFLKLGDFDRIAPTFLADDIQMDYYQNGTNVARATVRYVNDLDWEINLQRYINDEDGSMLLDDDDTPLFLD